MATHRQAQVNPHAAEVDAFGMGELRNPPANECANWQAAETGRRLNDASVATLGGQRLPSLPSWCRIQQQRRWLLSRIAPTREGSQESICRAEAQRLNRRTKQGGQLLRSQHSPFMRQRQGLAGSTRAPSSPRGTAWPGLSKAVSPGGMCGRRWAMPLWQSMQVFSLLAR